MAGGTCAFAALAGVAYSACAHNLSDFAAFMMLRAARLQVLRPWQMAEQAHLLALPHEVVSHAPGLHDPLHAPHVRHLLLGGQVDADVAVLVLQIGQQIHEEAVDHKGLVALPHCVQVDLKALHAQSLRQGAGLKNWQAPAANHCFSAAFPARMQVQPETLNQLHVQGIHSTQCERAASQMHTAAPSSLVRRSTACHWCCLHQREHRSPISSNVHDCMKKTSGKQGRTSNLKASHESKAYMGTIHRMRMTLICSFGLEKYSSCMATS